jgi:hypothetical protein
MQGKVIGMFAGEFSGNSKCIGLGTNRKTA